MSTSCVHASSVTSCDQNQLAKEHRICDTTVRGGPQTRDSRRGNERDRHKEQGRDCGSPDVHCRTRNGRKEKSHGSTPKASACPSLWSCLPCPARVPRALAGERRSRPSGATISRRSGGRRATHVVPLEHRDHGRDQDRAVAEQRGARGGAVLAPDRWKTSSADRRTSGVDEGGIVGLSMVCGGPLFGITWLWCSASCARGRDSRVLVQIRRFSIFVKIAER